ncbi:MAG: ABC transporter ATP-binding protein [Burkholderiales bacterium]|nr:ABC transporter ATP-binding protein [Burkholderiales bacterium]
MPLLEARQLHVDLRTHRGSAAAVRDVSFTLERGETIGLIGESGCGKSMTALALMGLAPENATVTGSVRLAGQELIGLPDRDWRRLRGNRIAMIFQEPMTALNPVHRVGAQIAEPLMLHQGLPARAARAQAIALMERVGIPEPARRADAWPHQFSGGQRQRLMIAMALACKPDVLIADEPTTALDVTVQKQILALIGELVAGSGMALVLISHDLALVAGTFSILVCTALRGRIRRATGAPAHPYTRGLLAARPNLAQRLHAHRSDRLPTIAGTVPDLFHLPRACPFAGRCAFTEEACFTEAIPRVRLSPTHVFDCRRAEVVLADARHVQATKP